MLMVLLGSFPWITKGSTDCDADELDLCEVDSSPSPSPEAEEPSVDKAPLMGGGNVLSFALALAMQMAGAQQLAWMPLVVPLMSMLPAATATTVTCGDLKGFYKTESCCGNPAQLLTDLPTEDLAGTAPTSAPTSAPTDAPTAAPTAAPTEAPAPPCPYSFAKPDCADAEPQSPRDLSFGAVGHKIPKAAVLTDVQAMFLPLVNVHFHLGAEHKSDSYNDDTDSVAYDGSSSSRRLSSDPRPGFMCPTDDLQAENLTDYTFQYCTGDVRVGKSYEVHYVHSSAGYTEAEKTSKGIDGMDDGLGGAANGRGLLNPMVVVQGQVYQIVQGAAYVDDLLHGWSVVDHSNSVMYAGSTTGPSHDNSVCSPYSITWHVDKDCHRVSPEAFDNLCQQKSELYNLVNDLAPHGSRVLLDPRWVVNETFVLPLM